MGRIDRLAERYKSYIGLPWQKDLAGAQRTLFIVYDKADERRLRARKDLFELITVEAGHGWRECDLTKVFAEWMASADYRDSYFESPEDLELKLEDDFLEHVAALVRIAVMIAKKAITTVATAEMRLWLEFNHSIQLISTSAIQRTDLMAVIAPATC